LTENNTNEEAMKQIKNVGIYYWEKNITLLDKLQKPKMPEAFTERISIMKKYCTLRITQYEFILKGIEQNTEQYSDSITYYETEIGKVIKEIGQ
jgi:rhomboid protease GluP